jgi:hypothetical protein
MYNILIEFAVPMKLVRLIKMCLNETYSKVRIGKHLSDSFPIEKKKHSMVWVHERTIPTERPPLVGEVIANFCG